MTMKNSTKDDRSISSGNSRQMLSRPVRSSSQNFSYRPMSGPRGRLTGKLQEENATPTPEVDGAGSKRPVNENQYKQSVHRSPHTDPMRRRQTERHKALVLKAGPNDSFSPCRNCLALTDELEKVTLARSSDELRGFMQWLTSGSKEDFGKASQLLFANEF